MSVIDVEDDNDDGIEESLRRSREMDENPEMSLTEEEFFASFKEYRRRSRFAIVPSTVDHKGVLE